MAQAHIDRSDIPGSHAANTQDFTAKRGWFAEPTIQPGWAIPEDVVIKVAVSGRSAIGQEGRLARGHFPMTIEAYQEATRRSLKAGAAGVHVDLGNIFDSDGNPLDATRSTYEVYREILDPLRDEFGDSFVVDLNVLRGENFMANVKPVIEGLADMAPVCPGYNRTWSTEAVKVLQENGCKPEIVIHGPGEIGLAKERLIDTGILEKPYYYIVLIGNAVDSGLSPFSYSWLPNMGDTCRQLLLIVEQLRAIDPDSVIMVCSAGRASTYLTTLSLMLGCHIRVGTEDTVWKYPHRDDLLESNEAAVTAAVEMAAALGRTARGADVYRQLTGITARDQ